MKNIISDSDVNHVVIPEDARAVLVWKNADGSTGTKVVTQGASVLNIERDLRSHMNEYPYSDQWLIQLRDYVDQRLAAREEARKFGGVSIPVHGGAQWALAENLQEAGV